MPIENQALRAAAIAERLVADVHQTTGGDITFTLQVLAIACGMMVGAAVRAGQGEFAKSVLIKGQTMGVDWQGNPIEVVGR